MAIGSSRSDFPLSSAVSNLLRADQKRRNARSGNPGDLGSESLNVVLLALEDLGGDKHGEVGVRDSESLAVRKEAVVRQRTSRGSQGGIDKHSDVEPSCERKEGSVRRARTRGSERTLNLLPDAVRPRLEDVAPRDIVVIKHLSLDKNLHALISSLPSHPNHAHAPARTTPQRRPAPS